MKLSDIINYDLSYWNVLGKTGGTGVPGFGKKKKVKGVDVWKRKPLAPITEYQRGGDYDWVKDKGAEKFNTKDTANSMPKFSSWSKSPKEIGSVMRTDGKGRRKKIIVRRAGKHTTEIVDDEGNKMLKSVTGRITPGDHLGKRYEGISGVGPAGLGGANQHTAPGPSELEYDLQYKNVKKEFRGKDTRKDIKTSKDKRERLKQYLLKRQEEFK